jgi:hypothetical protein
MNMKNAASAPGSSLNRKMVSFIATSVMFFFFSFGLTSVYAWFYANPTLHVLRVDALRALLVKTEAATPAPGLAGRVVYAAGAATATTWATDAEAGIVIDGALMVQRVIESFRIKRNASWNLVDIKYLSAAGPRLGDWVLTEPLLATTAPILRPTRAGQDYKLAAGMTLRAEDPGAAYVMTGGKVGGGPETREFVSDDQRVIYRALPGGPLSVIAMVDKTGTGLIPVQIDGESVALTAQGKVEPAAMFADAVKSADDARLQATLWALVIGWALFMIPSLWAPMPRRAALTAVPFGGVVLTLCAAVAAAPAGGVGGCFLAGQFVASLYLLVVVLFARRRGVTG